MSPAGRGTPTAGEAFKGFAVLVAFGGLLWFFAGPAVPPPVPFRLDRQDYSDTDLATMKTAYEVMLANCRPLRRDGNVEAVEAGFGPPWNPDRTTQWGWTREVRFTVKVPARPGEGAEGAAGHTLHIALGGGRRPGIATQDDVTRPICGTGGAPSGHDTFKDVTGLAFIR